jgi:hypothetical protein
MPANGRHRSGILKVLDCNPLSLENGGYEATFVQNSHLHIVGDNCVSHQITKVKSWLRCHKRFPMHFTPASASWLNMLERCFRRLSEKQ